MFDQMSVRSISNDHFNHFVLISNSEDFHKTIQEISEAYSENCFQILNFRSL